MSTPEEIARQEAEKAAAPPSPAPDAPKPTEEAPPETPAPEPKPAEEAPPAPPVASVAEPTEGAEARIRKLIGEREDARREAAYLRGLAEGRGPKAPDAAPAPLKIEDYLPTEQEFATVGLTAEKFQEIGRSYDDLLMAKSAFAIEKRNAVLTKRADEDRARASVAKSEEAFMGRIRAAAETDPDLPLIVNATNPADPNFVPISQAMAEVIRESDISPKILRHLANNKAEAMRIFNLSPLTAARELGRIEAKILATPAPEPPRRVSQAPEPVKSLTPTGVTEIDLDKVPIDDFMKKRNAQQFGAAR
jgi:hypothetical protein